MQIRTDCAIDPRLKPAGRLKAIWNAFVEPRWAFEYWGGEDGIGATERFKWHAQKAAALLRYSGSGEDAVWFWLDQISRDAPKAYVGLNHPQMKEIYDVCGLSAEYCTKCEADAIRSQVSAEAPRYEIEKFANDAFATARDRILKKYAKKERRVLSQVQLTHNSGGYLPALVKLKAEDVRNGILALAEAYAEAFTLYGMPSDAKAEKFLQTSAQQMTAGSISAVRGQLQLRSGRLRAPIEGQGMPWHTEIEGSMHSALKEGLLRLRKQRIEYQKSQRSLQPVTGGSRAEETSSRPPATRISRTKMSPKPQFANRAAWLTARLRERAWNKHDLARRRGPDHKTTQKILDGFPVREDVLDKLATALSTKVNKVTILQIPPD